jgi:hypothetical protein
VIALHLLEERHSLPAFLRARAGGNLARGLFDHAGAQGDGLAGEVGGEVESHVCLLVGKGRMADQG